MRAKHRSNQALMCARYSAACCPHTCTSAARAQAPPCGPASGEEKQLFSNQQYPSVCSGTPLVEASAPLKSNNRHCGFQLSQLHTAKHGGKGEQQRSPAAGAPPPPPPAAFKASLKFGINRNMCAHALTSSWRASATSTSSRIDLACSASSAARASSAACRCEPGWGNTVFCPVVSACCKTR